EQRRHGEDDHGVAEREEEADAERPLALAHQLAGGVVDRADVVGVERVTEPERVGRDADAESEDPAQGEERGEADHVQQQDHRAEPCQPPPLGGCQRASDPLPSRHAAGTLVLPAAYCNSLAIGPAALACPPCQSAWPSSS